jgi:hypothetical protein
MKSRTWVMVAGLLAFLPLTVIRMPAARAQTPSQGTIVRQEGSGSPGGLPGGNRGTDTQTKWGDQHTNQGGEWGDHDAGCACGGTPADHTVRVSSGAMGGWVSYDFSTCYRAQESSFTISVEYADVGCIWPWCDGPQFRILNQNTGAWYDFGTQGYKDHVYGWKTVTVPSPCNDYISSSGLITIEVNGSGTDDTCIRQVSYAFTRALPNLIVQSVTSTISGNKCWTPNMAIPVTVTIKNSGSYPYLCTTHLHCGSQEYTFPAPLNVNATAQYTFNLTGPSSPPSSFPSDYSVTATVDPHSAVEESYETDNSQGPVLFTWINTLGAPGNFAASDDRCNTIHLSWNSVSGASKYVIYRDGAARDSTLGTSYDDAITGAHNYTIYTRNTCGLSSGVSDGGTGLIMPNAVTTTSASTGQCGQITVLWSDSGDNETRYHVYRDGAGSPTADLPANTTQWVDTGYSGCGQTHTHNYVVKAYSTCGESTGNNTAQGWGACSVTPGCITSVTAADTVRADYCRITWTTSGECNANRFYVLRDGVQIADLGPDARVHEDHEGVGWQFYNYCVVAYNDACQAYSQQRCDAGARRGGRISGRVTTPGGLGVPGVQITAEPGSYPDVTDSDGAFWIRVRDWNYYTITPHRGNDGFNPAHCYADLSETHPDEGTCAIADTTVFPVNGKVRFDSTTCAVADVGIRVDGNQTPATTTAADGTYQVFVSYGSHTLTPVLAGHSFAPESEHLFVTGATNNVDFRDLLRHHATGRVVDACANAIGRARIIARAQNGCFADTVMTDPATGEFTLSLPPLRFDVTAEMWPYNPLIRLHPRSQIADLREGDVPLEDFIGNLPKVVEFQFPTPPEHCAVPVFEEYKEYPVSIHVYEQFADHQCDVDSLPVRIIDNVSDRNARTVIVRDGYYQDTLRGGIPNILNGPPDHGFQKSYQVAFLDTSLVYEQWAYVTGHKPREGATFTTVTPEIPFLILHDPPGDLSYSEMSRSTTVKLNTSLYFESQFSMEISEQFKIDAELYGSGFSGSIGNTLEVGAGVNSSVEFGLSVTSSESYKTYDGEELVGDDADLFAGAAVNIDYRATDVLSLDEYCNPQVRPSIAYNGNGYHTTFIYTAKTIRDDIIPHNIWLANHTPVRDSADVYLAAAQCWQHILDMNDSLKTVAECDTSSCNWSFSGCVERNVNRSTTLSATGKLDFFVFVNSELATSVGAKLFGSETEFGIKIKSQLKIGASVEAGVECTNSMGYTLKDNDCEDRFSVDVLGDPAYGTPLFRLHGGMSSCPHEPPTTPLDNPGLGVSPGGRFDIPPDTPAVFYLDVRNENVDTLGTRQYCLSMIPGSNPYGAGITVAGQALTNPICYTLDPGESQLQTMTVTRGPNSYEYYGLKLELASPCDGSRADTISVDVTFHEPCSRAVVDRPLDGWVVNTTSGDTVSVTLTYDSFATDFQRIEFQRKLLPNGSWMTERSFTRQQLPTNGVVSFSWNAAGLQDGDYVLRALAVCTGGTYYSPERAGVIDRRRPCLLGSPQPSDHILDPGDDIAFTLDENLDEFSVTTDCVRLFDQTTGQSIPITVRCEMNWFVLTPLWSPYEYENHNLRAQATCVRDMNGNTVCQPMVWDFYANQGDVTWIPDHLTATMLPGESPMVTSNLHNRGSQGRSFTISGCSICTANPTSGYLPALGGEVPIHFTMSNLLTQGTHQDTVYVTVNNWPPEPIYLTAIVGCAPPGWSVNPSQYNYEMSLTAVAMMGDVEVTDADDNLGAFVTGSCRGVVASIVGPGGRRLFSMTIRSNVAQGETVGFQFYDFSECKVYDVRDQILFSMDGEVGSITEPYVLHLEDRVRVRVPVTGYDWFSLNAVPADPHLNSVLACLDGHATKIRDQFAYAQYSPTYGWYGSLTSLADTTMYKINMTQPDTLEFLGQMSQGDKPIPVMAGYNWIPYLCQSSLTVKNALSSVEPNGLRIRGKGGYSEYYTPNGQWYGALTIMEPGEGYILKMAASDTLAYPCGQARGLPEPVQGPPPLNSLAVKNDIWTVRPNDYPYEALITAAYRSSVGANVEGDVLGAFVGTECRGLARGLSGPSGEVLFFVTVYTAASEGEDVVFRLYDQSAQSIVPVSESVRIVPDSEDGSLTNPILLHPTPGSDVDLDLANVTFGITAVRPMPARNTADILYGLTGSGGARLEILDVQGRVIRRMEGGNVRGRFTARWDGRDDGGRRVASGIYFCRLCSGGKRSTASLIMVR